MGNFMASILHRQTDRQTTTPLLKEKIICFYEGVLPDIGIMPFLWMPAALYEHLPLYNKKTMDTAVKVETVVKGFSRYHKYTLGTDLRNQTREIVRLVMRAKRGENCTNHNKFQGRL